MGGKDVEPHARMLLVRPFSALVTAQTVFFPLLAQILGGLCTQDMPVSSALYFWEAENPWQAYSAESL